jgi:hypothetical protein
VRSIAQVLQFELHSRIPTSVRREIGGFQYSEQIKGGFDPRTPLNRDERQTRLMNGGLLSERMHSGGLCSFLSLGEVFDGWVLCAIIQEAPLQLWANFRQRALDTAIAEITKKTDLKISLESLGRSKHRRVTSVTFAIKTQPTPKRRQTP